MQIVPYNRKYRQAFIDLNLAWLNRCFKVEPLDEEMLGGVEKLVAQGAEVYFALEGEVPVATCMILPKGGGVWEVCKLATDERFQGRGAGQAVFNACIGHAESHGAKKIVLTSNRILKRALHIYEKAGFCEVPLSEREYDRADIQFEYTIDR